MSGAGWGKRPSGGNSPFGPPEKVKKEKTTTTLTEPFRIGGVSSTEEMDMKVIQFKNKKLCERLEQRQAMEDELQGKIEKLEKRQATDDTILLIVNRYWSQLEESIHVLSQRLKPEPPAAPAPDPPLDPPLDPASMEVGMIPPAPPVEPQNEEQQPEQQEDNQQETQERRPPAPPDGLVETPAPTELVWKPTTDALPPPPLSENATAYLATLDHSSEKELSLQLQGHMQFSKETIACLVSAFDRLHSCIYELCNHVQAAGCEDDSQSDIISLNRTLMEENVRLQDLASFLQGRHHKMSMEYNELVDKVTSSETKVSEMETTVGHLQWDIEKLSESEQRLNKHLAEALEHVNTAYNSFGSSGGLPGGQKITLTIQTFQSLNVELEHNQKLSNSHMAELEELQLELQEAVREREELEMDLQNIPDEVVKETPEFKRLQSQYSLLFGESVGVKTQLDKAQALLLSAKNAHLLQIKHMKSDKLSLQKKLRTKVIQLEDTLAQVCKEYEMLHIKFELDLAAKEQAAPTSKEVRHLISSLQNYNLHLKGNVQNYKRKLCKTQVEISKLRCQSGDTAAIHILEMTSDSIDVKKEENKEQEDEERRKEHAHEREWEAKRERERECEIEWQRSEELKWKNPDTLKMMRAELKKAQESQMEMKPLLDMYESGPKGKRDKVQLMTAECKSKAELNELRVRVREMEEREKESKKMAYKDTLGKIRVAEETIDYLQKKLPSTKKEQEALMSELNVTGQAFEDMQEQNSRLMLQLREKDNVNFQLMSELNKSNQIYMQLREEKEGLAEQVMTFKTQLDAQLLVVQKLEERKGILQSSLVAQENKLGVRTQAVKSSKRKAVEAAQLAEELKVQLEHKQTKLKEIQVSVAEKRTDRERESGNLKQAQEVLSKLRRKLEKQKNVEFHPDTDEILHEEINQYKAKLHCPCCNTRDKDTVLTKCFHVFCYECLKTRYGTRERKCPMCNCAFGASDFHRIYFA